ncbi:MAG: phospholipid ABC transporter ATP-binding protein MlaF, partial [Proteobacteria bacterium]|nr:phospholipid ABC transporter ATP-binding protein MlaF [Pseudomonadota bacterium]
MLAKNALKNLIEIHDLYYSRGSLPIFSGLNMEIRRGEVTAIL